MGSDEISPEASRNYGESTYLPESSVLLQMNNVAPPSYDECPPVYQGLLQEDVEARYLLKLSKETTDLMDGLIGERIKKPFGEVNGIAPRSINIYTRTDGFFCDCQTSHVGNQSTNEKFIWRPDGVWRDGTRASVVNGGILIETKLKDFGVPDEDRTITTHRYELVVEDEKNIVNFYKNNVLTAQYIEKVKMNGAISFLIAILILLLFFFMLHRGKENATVKP